MTAAPVRLERAHWFRTAILTALLTFASVWWLGEETGHVLSPAGAQALSRPGWAQYVSHLGEGVLAGLHRWMVLGIILVGCATCIGMAFQSARSLRQMLVERARLEQLVRQRSNELMLLAQHLQTAREDERARIARDLHDEMGALLTTARLDVAVLLTCVSMDDPAMQAHVRRLAMAIDQVIVRKRGIVEALNPGVLEMLGLAEALRQLGHEFSAASGVPISVRVEEIAWRGGAALTAYRFVQEALSNMVRHAQARQARVVLRTEAGWALMEVVDDGRGFTPPVTAPGRFGLMGMRYRVEAEGGVFSVYSAPGRGTRLEAKLPLDTPRLDTPGRRL